MFDINLDFESRIDREKYIGKTFKTKNGDKFTVLGVWEHSPIGRAKRYVIEFSDGHREVAYGTNINNGRIGYKIKDKRVDTNVKTALLITDAHFCYEDKPTINILYQIVGELGTQIDEVIDLGDGINNSALSKFVDLDPVTVGLKEEITRYEQHIRILRNLAPQARFIMLEDNHYHLRKERWLAENKEMIGLLPDIDSDFDDIIAHGVPYMPFDQKRFGLIHGINYGKFFTKAHLEMYGMDIICGHTHTMQTYVSASGQTDMQPKRSYGIPCLCRRQNYLQGVPTRQVGGFAILTYDPLTTNYNIEYVIVENNRALFRGKLYEANNKNYEVN